MTPALETRRRPSLSRQLLRLGAELRRRRQAEITHEGVLSDLGLRPVAKAVLMVVDQRGSSSQREISDALGLAASDLVSLLDQLEEADLIERRRDEVDRRRNVVHTTRRGSRAAAKLNAAADRAEAGVLARLTRDEQTELLRLINRALGED